MVTLRKALVISVSVITVLSMSMLAVPFQTQAAASAGDLIKMDGLSSVYYLGADGKRYVFPNESTYFSWYSDFSTVVTIPQSELESYPLGANVVIRPGTKLVKITTDPKVYAVEPDGVLRHIPDEATALSLYGENWAKRVVDVPDSFFTNYTIGSALTTDYPAGSLIKLPDAPDVYYIASDGSARKFASEAAFTGNRFKWDDVITTATGFTLPTAGSDITGAEDAMTDTSQGGGGGNGIEPGAGTGLTVALSATTPASATLPTGASLVPVADYNFTASNDGDVTVKSVKLTRIGIGNDTDFSYVYLYEGNTRLTNSRTISSSNHAVTFNGLSIVIPKGETKTITARVVVAGTSGNDGLSIAAASDITTNGATVSGSFPMQGNLFAMSSVSAGSLTYTLQSVSDTTLKVGETKKEVSKIKIDTSGSGEDVVMQFIAFTNNGGADANDLVNFKLYQGTTLVAELDSTTNDVALMEFTNPFTITKGNSKIFTLKADIMGGVGSNAIYYAIDDATDVSAIGGTYGYGVTATAGSGSASSITVEAGEMTIELDGPAAYKVTSDVDDAVLANLTITTGGDDDVEVKNFYAYIDATEADSDDVLDNALENVQLVNTDTGDVYDVTSDDASDDDDYFFKVTNFTVPAGVSHWSLEADLINTGTDMVEDGDVFKFVMYAGADTTTLGSYPSGATSGYKGVEAKNKDNKNLDDIKPAALLNGNNVTVDIPSLAVSNVTLSAGTSVLSTDGEMLIKVNLEAGASSDVRVTEMDFEDSTTGGATANNLANASNYTLWVVNDGADTALQSGVSSAGSGATVVFSDLQEGSVSGLIIPAGETRSVYVSADINSASSTGSELRMRMSDAGVTAEDSDGDTLNATTQVTGDTTSVDGRLITLVESGNITFTVDNTSPDNAHIVLSDSTDNEVLDIKADADYEDVTLKTLNFENTATSSTNTSMQAISKVTLLKDGVVVTTGTIDYTASKIKFENLDTLATPLTIDKDNDSVLTLKVDFAGIGDGATDTASSGESVVLALKAVNVEAIGYSSNNDLATSAITVTSVSSQTQYIYASKVLATAATQPTTPLSTGNIEVLKFTLTPSTNDDKDALFSGLTLNVTYTGSASSTGAASLMSGSSVIATATDPTNTGTFTFTPSTPDSISSGGETYTIKMNLYTDGLNDAVTASIDVNGAAGSGDDITWKDYSSGSSVTWIDFGEGSDVTTINNTVNTAD